MKAMKVSEFVKNADVVDTFIGAYFGETENLVNIIECLDLNLDYEIVDIEIDQDVYTDHDTILVISKKDYQDLLNRLNERDR